ncbi:hypothetical protein [Moraxella caprae]|uniref:hypothetical protein n=1 Tax=Moraxella caprae TaxID=90240 RepID=UPI001D171846|nr:hypothetical protein [Moraxella caprae]
MPESDPLTKISLTPSQKALGKYGLLVVALFVLQVFLGGFVAHYTVEGHSFYGIPVADWLPYSLVRTWHIQAALFWIATAFLAAGLFFDPHHQWWQRLQIPKTRRGHSVGGAYHRVCGFVHCSVLCPKTHHACPS